MAGDKNGGRMRCGDAKKVGKSMGEIRARPPSGIDPLGVSGEGAAVYDLIRDEIICGRLVANDRLVVAELAERHRVVQRLRARSAAAAARTRL